MGKGKVVFPMGLELELSLELMSRNLVIYSSAVITYGNFFTWIQFLTAFLTVGYDLYKTTLYKIIQI